MWGTICITIVGRYLARYLKKKISSKEKEIEYSVMERLEQNDELWRGMEERSKGRNMRWDHCRREILESIMI